MKYFSLRRRFWLISLFLSLIFGLLLGFALDKSFEHAQMALEKRRAEALLHSLIASVELEQSNVFDIDESILSEVFFSGEAIAIIQDQNGNVLWYSSDTPPTITLKRLNSMGTLSFSKMPAFKSKPQFLAQIKFLWQVEQASDYILQFNIIEKADNFLLAQQQFRKEFLAYIIALAFLFLLLQFIFIGQGFKPLQNIRQQILAIRQGQQNNIQLDSAPTELKTSIESINQLLEHQNKQNTLGRQALDDLAHSLKTPLSALSLQLQNFTSDTEQEQIQDMQAHIQDASNIIQRKLNTLKQKQTALFNQKTLIGPIIARIAKALQKLHKDKNIQWDMQMPPGSSIAMHPDDFYELMGNILDNAFKYCNSQVKILFTDSKEHKTLKIINDGQTFPQEHSQNLLTRGKKLDESHQNTGLGLHISENIVKRHNGTIQLYNENNLACVKIVFLAKA